MFMHLFYTKSLTLIYLNLSWFDLPKMLHLIPTDILHYKLNYHC